MLLKKFYIGICQEERKRPRDYALLAANVACEDEGR
jgi:hypothetical protein